ncbi:MAG: 4Fe-4S dicluster domain-containing protein [Anaerolineaceae bacterium]|nr:4Fe-4S dicluster domain-containing protein [Anaerolineaceae bacterium]
MPEVRILRKYCKGCGLCVEVCPVECLRMSDDITAAGVCPAEVVETADCTGCLQCHTVCPDAAIEVYE